MNRVKAGVIVIFLSAVSWQFTNAGLCAENEPARASSAEDGFAGFPVLSLPGRRSAEVLTSDGVEGLVRPKWTRAMGDVGAWPAMFRFGKRIFLYFPKVKGHRGPYRNNDLPMVRLVSDDEGKSWQELPSETGRQAGEFVVVDNTIYRYDFDDLTQTRLRTSKDGIHWTEGVKVYEPGLWLWGVTYDPLSRTFYAPPHANPKKVKLNRQIQLIRSKDGVNWEYVSTVHDEGSESESTLRVEPDGTMVILMRKKYSASMCWIATGKPPYTNWDISSRPSIAEGEHFFEIGGKTFVPSRAVYRGKDPQILKNEILWDRRRALTVVYHFTAGRQLVPWAVMDSMDDCSYPWLVETPTEVLCAYYSQHEDKSCKVFLCAYDKEAFLRGPK